MMDSSVDDNSASTPGRTLPPKDVIVRQARTTDAAALAQLCEATFRETFGTHNETHDMDAYIAEHFSEERIAAGLSASNARFFVADKRGRLVGYAKISWGRLPACISDTSSVEVERIYVSKDEQSTGVGTMLVSRCLIEADSRAAGSTWLGVWEHNPKAITYYESHGWEVVGERNFQLGSETQRDLVMSRAGTPA